jgi:hypothetical protein
MPDLPSHPSCANPPCRLSRWQRFGIFCLAIFLILSGVVFIPWDAKAPEDADLKLKPPAIAAEENAFAWFEKAAARFEKIPKINGKDGQERNWDYELLSGIGSSLENWDADYASDVLAAYAVVFPDLEKGLACRQYLSPDPEFSEPCRLWMKYSPLTGLLFLKSKQAQLSGNPQEAVKPALQALHFGKLMMDGSDSLIEWQEGLAREEDSLNRLEELAADDKTPVPALREMLDRLNAWNPDGIADGYRRAMRGQYRMSASGVDFFWKGLDYYDGFHGCRWIPYVFKPNMTKRALAACCRHQIGNAALPQSRRQVGYPGKPRCPDSWLGRTELLLKPNMVGQRFFFRTMEIDELDKCLAFNKPMLLANVAALRLKIALRLHEQNFHQLPDDLGALVPEFLPAVPNDPFDDRPFRYSKVKKIVWSVGVDGFDNGGKNKNNGIASCIFMNSENGDDDVVMPLGTRELKPNPARTPDP